MISDHSFVEAALDSAIGTPAFNFFILAEVCVMFFVKYRALAIVELYKLSNACVTDSSALHRTLQGEALHSESAAGLAVIESM